MKLNRFTALLQMLPGILGTVAAVENAITPPKSGQSKLDLVVKVVSIAAAATPDIAEAISTKDVELATALIATAAVNAMNTTGVFEK